MPPKYIIIAIVKTIYILYHNVLCVLYYIYTHFDLLIGFKSAIIDFKAKDA